jgi:hypothetical protein
MKNMFRFEPDWFEQRCKMCGLHKRVYVVSGTEYDNLPWNETCCGKWMAWRPICGLMYDYDRQGSIVSIEENWE